LNISENLNYFLCTLAYISIVTIKCYYDVYSDFNITYTSSSSSSSPPPPPPPQQQLAPQPHVVPGVNYCKINKLVWRWGCITNTRFWDCGHIR
jgi:hypothetical protein